MFYVREILHVYRYILELETTWVRKVKKIEVVDTPIYSG
jgi:hypothetical protein